jgi:hypothetical protein
VASQRFVAYCRSLKSVCLIAGFIVLASSSSLTAHDLITTNLTFVRDVSPIFARRCAACHSAGAAIPLDSYQKARPWAVAIKEQVLARDMPPWGAVKGFGDLAPDHAMTQEEILIIAAWVIGGAPEGKAALAEKPLVSKPPAEKPLAAAGLAVNTQSTLTQAFALAGIRPDSPQAVDSARIVAVLPDGRVTPLLWLFHYDARRMPAAFQFRAPLALPAGTVIQSDAPLHFSLFGARVP